jgi:hypothetical protein
MNEQTINPCKKCRCTKYIVYRNFNYREISRGSGVMIECMKCGSYLHAPYVDTFDYKARTSQELRESLTEEWNLRNPLTLERKIRLLIKTFKNDTKDVLSYIRKKLLRRG